MDAIPGVYTPEDFQLEVGKSLDFIRAQIPSVSNLSAWHARGIGSALVAERARITMSKAVVESPLLNALGLGTVGRSIPRGTAPEAAVQLVEQEQRKLLNRVLENPAAYFHRVSDMLEDASKSGASARQLRNHLEERVKTGQLTAEQYGREVVRLDSAINVRLVRPATHLLFASYRKLPGVKQVTDEVFKQILHVPLDDPYLGLAEIIVPGSPAR